jgi:hypothetical protein
MSSRPVRPAPLLLALTGHLLLTVLIWRDIDRRPTTQLRGSKTLWRVLTALNTGNHVVYLVVGRRRAP